MEENIKTRSRLDLVRLCSSYDRVKQTLLLTSTSISVDLVDQIFDIDGETKIML